MKRRKRRTRAIARIMTVKEIMKLSTVVIANKISLLIRTLPKKQLALMLYGLQKRQLPRLKLKKKRSKKQLANDKKLGKMAKARARKAKRRKR